jgi:EAL domain-containing protein (putative c-di-GMP-specific phosphodiesterase class I)
MSCFLSTAGVANEASEVQGLHNRLHILAAGLDMGERVAEILTEHRVVLERNGELMVVLSPEKHARILALLRQVLNEAERRAVSVFTGDGSRFPVLRLLDEWWRVHETAWFAKALSEDRFVTWFQPIVDTSDRRIIGHECLIRLFGGRTYSGAEILDAAWVRDEMNTFDSHARNLAIRSAATQCRRGAYFVNFVPSSIYNPELCLKNIVQTLQESGLRPENIVFEVVEAELVRDPIHLQHIIDFFRAHGFRVALDDFGTGADSTEVLQNLRPDFIKIDRALTRCVENPLFGARVRRLTEVSDRLGVTVVAKGVEHRHAMENLWLLGVQTMQGYLFGRPDPHISASPDPLVNLASALQAGNRMAAPAVH